MRRPSQSVGARVSLACLWEALAAKPGNVYRGADFDDLTFADMATAGAAIGDAVETHTTDPIGVTILAAVRAMRTAVGTNTHLGTVLLLVPLAKASQRGGPLPVAVRDIVANTTVADAADTYEAIRLAQPGGLGRVEAADVAEAPTVALHEAMQLAADRDLVARQYTNGLEDVFRLAARIGDHVREMPLHDAIVAAHVEQLARDPDTLIARKLGPVAALEAQQRAQAALGTGPPGSEAYQAAAADLDFWLRADGHRRNPGATADLIGAALFVLLSEERLSWPVRFYGPAETS